MKEHWKTTRWHVWQTLDRERKREIKDEIGDIAESDHVRCYGLWCKNFCFCFKWSEAIWRLLVVQYHDLIYGGFFWSPTVPVYCFLFLFFFFILVLSTFQLWKFLLSYPQAQRFFPHPCCFLINLSKAYFISVTVFFISSISFCLECPSLCLHMFLVSTCPWTMNFTSTSQCSPCLVGTGWLDGAAVECFLFLQVG